MELDLVDDPHSMTHCPLAGLRISTIGDTFVGLSTIRFRYVLRDAGVRVEKRPRQCPDMVIVGERPSLAAKLRVLPFYDAPNKPVVVGHREFVVRFYKSLRSVRIRNDLTF